MCFIASLSHAMLAPRLPRLELFTHKPVSLRAASEEGAEGCRSLGIYLCFFVVLIAIRCPGGSCRREPN